MSSAVQKILAEIETLTPAEQHELRKHLEQVQRPDARARARLVEEIKGKYAFLPISSDALAEEKQHELAVEDHRFEKR